MKIRIKLLVGLFALLIPTSIVFASNAWSVYHWRSDNLTPTVSDRTRASLYDVSAAVEEWFDLSAPINPVITSKNNGNIKVSEATSNFWLGLARVFLDEDGHITKGEVKLNTFILSRDFGPDAADHVLCQELGHILGLDHQSGPGSLNSCMSNEKEVVLGTATRPNDHDIEQLRDIYNHPDEVPDDDGPGGGPPCSRNPRPGCRTADGWVIIDVFPIPPGD